MWIAGATRTIKRDGKKHSISIPKILIPDEAEYANIERLPCGSLLVKFHSRDDDY
jgi:hypothetical protein